MARWFPQLLAGMQKQGITGEDAIRNWFEQAAKRGWLDDMSDVA